MLTASIRKQKHSLKDNEVNEFKFVICKIRKSKLTDGGYELFNSIVSYIDVEKNHGFYYDRYKQSEIVRIQDKFYAVLEVGCYFNTHDEINGHGVKLIPISISKFVGELIIGDTYHD